MKVVFYDLVKRGIDISLALILLVLFLPFWVIVPILIRLDSPGPIIYRHKRVGKNGKPFHMYKFRSMVDGADEYLYFKNPHLLKRFKRGDWKLERDPRITSLGRVLRSLTIDEFPQLINVIKGEMSLVGPRPERPIFVDKFREDIPRYFMRHKVKSGITGWAQVNGLRGDTSLEERTKYDLFYVENWSLGFDIKIILMTLRTLFRQKNAY